MAAHSSSKLIESFPATPNSRVTDQHDLLSFDSRTEVASSIESLEDPTNSFSALSDCENREFTAVRDNCRAG